MTPRTAAFLLVLSSASLAGGAEYRTGQPVMGTILEVTVLADSIDQARGAAAAAISEVKRWDDVLTTWRAEGELAKLNRAAGKGPVAVSASLHQGLTWMMTLAAATGGAFDPGVGALVNLWRAPASPDAHQIGSVRGAGIAAVLSLTPGTAALADEAALDAGAIGKGIALDAAVAVLRAEGIEQAFLDFGTSSQIALGAPPDSPQGWRVAIAGLGVGTLRGFVTLRDAALSTSRTRELNAPEGAIIDPHSGRPVADARLATVRSSTAAAADAWSTAVVVDGRAGVDQARRANVEVFFEDREGALESPKFIDVSE